ncbi:MAG: AMP-binding protein, partial [Desulfomicrobium escambiense]|nr:AMP-binding protein [Desulfomicrobium escambiense]
LRIAKVNTKDTDNFLQHLPCPGVTMTTTKDPVERRVSTVGRSFPHTELKIVDAKTGKIVPTGEIGEICARGYCVMKCYYNNPSATHATLDKDHWNHTGDLGTMDEEGYFRIVGRLKDMVIRGGENIYPREIEEFLHHHEKIADVYVVGVPDIKYGEELCAWVKMKPDQTMTEQDVKDFCKGKIAHYQDPAVCHVCQRLSRWESPARSRNSACGKSPSGCSGLQEADKIETA